MEKSIEKFEALVLRTERFEAGLKKKLESMSSSEQTFLKLGKDLTLEIEELRSARHAVENSLSKNITDSIKENIHSVLPQVMPQLIGEFVRKTEGIAAATTKKAEKLNDIIDATVKDACHLIENKKRSMTWRKAGITVAFCFSSLLTALCIHYFYPTNVHYQMTGAMIKSHFLGEAVIDMYDELTPKQKDRLLEGVKRRYQAGMR